MKLFYSPRALRTTNNVFLGLSMISAFFMAFQDAPSHSAGQELARNAAVYTWLGFLTFWVIGMLVGFTCELLKKNGGILIYILRASCGIGFVHVLCVPLMFLL